MHFGKGTEPVRTLMTSKTQGRTEALPLDSKHWHVLPPCARLLQEHFPSVIILLASWSSHPFSENVHSLSFWFFIYSLFVARLVKPSVYQFMYCYCFVFFFFSLLLVCFNVRFMKRKTSQPTLFCIIMEISAYSTGNQDINALVILHGVLITI